MTQDPQLDTRLTKALEAPPTVTIPAEFAARIAASIPAPSPLTRVLTPLRRRRPSATWIATTLATTALLAALCILAPHTHATLTTWLSLTRTRL